MRDLSIKYGVPDSLDVPRVIVDRRASKARSAANALLGKHGAKIPPEAQAKLRAIVAEYCGRGELTGTLAEVTQLELEQTAALEPRTPNPEYVGHGERIVAKIAGSADSEGELGAFVRGWRAHFVAVLRPDFLPMGWDVNSRVTSGDDDPQKPPWAYVPDAGHIGSRN